MRMTNINSSDSSREIDELVVVHVDDLCAAAFSGHDRRRVMDPSRNRYFAASEYRSCFRTWNLGNHANGCHGYSCGAERVGSAPVSRAYLRPAGSARTRSGTPTATFWVDMPRYC